MRRIWYVLALALTACGDVQSSRLDAIEQSSDAREAILVRNAASYRLTEADQQNLRRLTADMVARSRTILSHLDRAAETYRSAARLHGLASNEYKHAILDYEDAQQKFREIAATLLVAAASDLLRFVCGPTTSTQQYRQQLRRDGINLSGKDIDHIFPRSKGGADQPWNYMPLDSSINCSLGNRGFMYKLSNFPLSTLRAYALQAVSLLACAP